MDDIYIYLLPPKANIFYSNLMEGTDSEVCVEDQETHFCYELQSNQVGGSKLL